MKAFAIRVLHVTFFVVGILATATLFALACEALQLGPFVHSAPPQPSAVQAGFVMLLACGALLTALFKHYLD